MLTNFDIAAQGGAWKAITNYFNYFYFTPQLGRGYNEMAWAGLNQDIVVKGNHFIGGFQPVVIRDWASVISEQYDLHKRVSDGIRYSQSASRLYLGQQ